MNNVIAKSKAFLYISTPFNNIVGVQVTNKDILDYFDVPEVNNEDEAYDILNNNINAN